MATNKDKSYLYDYFISYGYQEDTITKVLSKISNKEYKKILQQAYGVDYKEKYIASKLNKRDKNLLFGVVFKNIKQELEKTLKFTKNDLETLKEIQKKYNNKHVDFIIILLKYGYINNKSFSVSQIKHLLNNKVSTEKINQIIGDYSLIQQLTEQLDQDLLEETNKTNHKK